MSNCPLCNLEPTQGAGGGRRSNGLLRRAWEMTQWLCPTVAMIMIPKCPMCVAADIAIFSGLGVSVKTARWIQILMLCLCGISIVYLAIRYFRRRTRARGKLAAI
jgi:hypothetical protein